MTIEAKLDGSELLISLEGELNTITAPELEKVVTNNIDGVTTLIFDFTKLTYLSSAGLRVLLASKKAVGTNGRVIIRHPNSDVLDVLDITGFINILEIEN